MDKNAKESVLEIITSSEPVLLWSVERDDALEKNVMEVFAVNNSNLKYTKRAFHIDDFTYYINVKNKVLLKEPDYINKLSKEVDKIPVSNRYVTMESPEVVLKSFLDKGYKIVDSDF